ncbi:methanesulfonate monooxygenase [Sulfuritalea sp.]|uniref:methanesulfonate monooxygenase n=1 Tax=Sulfuritalea sp. TaxID=2480090 RepID=UPI00286D8188|nr:methanesulfonate monooxygenase [Sulfuritalea sp.]
MGASREMAVQQVHELIYESCLMLNAEKWNDYLELCDKSVFNYSIVNYSPEIRRDQCWMERDYKGLKSIFDLLPKHNSDRSQLTRHATVYKVEFDPELNQANALTLVTIYRTQLDGINSHFESGVTSLFAVGKYMDVIGLDAGKVNLKKRVVALDTRQVDIGSHYPL